MEEIGFGTNDVSAIDAIVDRFCQTQLGAGVSDVLFRATSVGAVVAVELIDGRRVLVKAHQPRETRERLHAVQGVQSGLHSAGFPCPEPLVGAVPHLNGHLTAEAVIDDGEFQNTHDATCRRLIAEALAAHLELIAAMDVPPSLGGGWQLSDGHRLWPAEAHSPAFDFAATAMGAEWIDALATRAKRAITQPARLVAGHSDWSGKHFRFAESEITAVYDWDSLAVRPEAAIVGCAAMTYTTRFDLPGVPRAPDPGEMGVFIDEYSNARHRSLTRCERHQITHHAVLIAAYTARCEHCGVGGYDADSDPDSFTAALRTHADAYLTV